MRLESGVLRASPTDLANFLVCRHKTVLDLAVAKGDLAAGKTKVTVRFRFVSTPLPYDISFQLGARASS